MWIFKIDVYIEIFLLRICIEFLKKTWEEISIEFQAHTDIMSSGINYPNIFNIRNHMHHMHLQSDSLELCTAINIQSTYDHNVIEVTLFSVLTYPLNPFLV